MRRVRDVCITPRENPTEWREALERAGLPEMYWRSNIPAIDSTEITEWISTAVCETKTWLGRGNGFYIFGELNSGKSSLAAILLMEAAKRCERCMWLPVREVPTVRFRETERHSAMSDRLETLDLLVLDDLGAESFRLTSAAGAALEAVARIMYDRGRSLIITSNIAWDHLDNAYADAPGFVSVVKRRIVPVGIVNDQWPSGLRSAW